MNFPDELKFLEKPLFYLKVELSQESLTRIVLWTILFVGLTHHYAPKVEPQLPYTEQMAKQNLTPIATATSDPKYTRNDLQTLPENSLLWVSGSSIAIKPTEESEYVFLPSQIKTNKEQYISVKMARRMLDTYTMVKEGIKRKPSAMIITLNPFWELQDTSAFFKTNLMNKGVGTWLNQDDWHLIPVLASPGDCLWASIGGRHNFIAHGYDYLKLAQSRYKKEKPKKSKKKKQNLSYNQPTLFWMMNRYNEDKDFNNHNATKWQAEVMANNNLSQSKWGQQLLRNMLEAIKQSNIPTFIYVAPVDPAIKKTPARVAYRTVQGQFDLLLNEYKSDQIRVVTNIPANVRRSLKYTDYLHLKNSGHLPQFLSSEIRKLKEKP